MSDTELPASQKTLDALQRDGLLNPAAHAAASGLLQQNNDWSTWARRVLLCYGGTLSLIGVIYFFAHNWQEMPKFVKFGVIEGAILACVGGAWFRGFEKTSGQILLTAASVLVGVLLAVFGQVYQTGADPYELFAGWAALSFGFVVLSKFAGLWALWLILVNTAAILYWRQVAGPAHDIGFGILCLLLAMINGGALALREWCVHKGVDWLKQAGLRHILITAALLPLSIPAVDTAVRLDETAGTTVLAAVAWILASAGIYVLYRQRYRDVAVLSIVTLGVTVVGLTFVGKVLDEAMNDNTGWFLTFSFIVLGFTTASVLLLKRESAQLLSHA